MDDAVIPLVLFFLLAVLLCAIVLPIIAVAVSIRSRKKLNQELERLRRTTLTTDTVGQIPLDDLAPMARAFQELERRVARIEAALAEKEIASPRGVMEPPAPATAPAAVSSPPPPSPTRGDVPAPQRTSTTPSTQPATYRPQSLPRRVQVGQIESIIGRRWLGWIAVALILFATAFFLKYAFDNRWIGELGRVTIGIMAGMSLTLLGLKYYHRGWRIFSQILTAGGVVLLYLSAYAAFGYYHLATQKAAFTYLAILVAEAAGLALLYDAPAIAIMALIGGFLTPILLRSDRDQYGSLFGYIAALDLGALVLLKPWVGLGPIAFAGTHLLFWSWYIDHYHPRKLIAVMIFQSSVFAIFLLARVSRRLIRKAPEPDERPWFTTPFSVFATCEDLGILLANPFVFFATAYHLLNRDHHQWMGVFAIIMSLIYAGTAKLVLSPIAQKRLEALVMVAIAITFVTLAIPIQLHANWITIAWSVEALAIIWVGLVMKSTRLQVTACGLFLLALGKLVFVDTGGLQRRSQFTPILNKYFLSSIVIVVCLFGAAALVKRAPRMMFVSRFELVFTLVALAVLWLVTSVETFTYFQTRAIAFESDIDRRHELWLGQMALSVLWSVYAAVLMAIGFIRRAAAMRWAALGLFGVTVIKVMLVDIAVLQQLYRIVAFFVLGLLLLLVAWGYHKAFHAKEAPQ
jgi:uncharacterized membrane protein